MNPHAELIAFLRTPWTSLGTSKFDHDRRDERARAFADALEAVQTVQQVATWADYRNGDKTDVIEQPVRDHRGEIIDLLCDEVFGVNYIPPLPIAQPAKPEEKL